MTDHKKRQEIPVNRVDFLDDLGVALDQAKFDAAREADLSHLAVGGRVLKERPGRRFRLTEYLEELEIEASGAGCGECGCNTDPQVTVSLIKKLRAALVVIRLYKKDRNQWTREDIDLARSLEWIEVP